MLGVTPLIGGLLVLSGPAAYWDWSWVKQHSATTEIVASVVGTAMGLVLFWVAAVRACRLFSAAPDAVIDADGVTLKPCMAPRPLAWHEITGSRIRREQWRGAPVWVLELDLATPLQTLTSGFLPSRKIRLMGGSPKQITQAGRMVRHYRSAARSAR